MGNVREQVQKQEDFTENFEALTNPNQDIQDNQDLEPNYFKEQDSEYWEELSDEFDLSDRLVVESQEDDLEGFLPNFINPPQISYFRDQELKTLNLALLNNALVTVTGKISKFGLAAKLFQDYDNPTKFWVDAHVSGFSDFAQWAIAHLHSESDKNKYIPEGLLIQTLVKLFLSHSCLVVVNQVDQSKQRQEFWLEFLHVWSKSLSLNPEISTQVSSKIIVTSRESLGFIPELELSEALSFTESADLLTEMGIIGDRQDLESFGQLLRGQPLSLILAANLLKAEEQIPQIRNLVRYGKIFDLNQPNRNGEFTAQNVFDRSFKRLLPKLRNLLTVASLYTQPFNLEDMQGINSDSNSEIDLGDLHKLEQLGLIRDFGQDYFYCEPQIRELMQIPDAKSYHEQIIKYLWTKTKPYFEWECDRNIAPYLAIFDHCCAIGEHYRAFYIIHDETDQCVDRYLELQGKHFLRISLFQPLLTAWRNIQSGRSEFGAVLMGLGNAYSALGNYVLAIPLYQEWLDILVKRNDVLERRIKAQCLYKLAIALFAQAPNQSPNHYQPILSYYQESLEIAVRSGDRSLELHNLLGLGNLYFSRREFTQALEYFERQLNLARELNNIESQIEGLPMLAHACKAIKQYPKAIELYRMHLSLVLGNYGANQDLRADSLENLAQIYQILGEYPEAKATYQDCLDLGIELGIEHPQASCLIGLGISSDRLGQFKEAISYYQQVPNHENHPECLIHLATAHNSLGQYKEAVGFYEKALKLSLQKSDRTLQVKSIIGLGNVQNSLGKLVKAIQFYEQAWELSKDIPDQKAIAVGNLGNVYNALGQYQEAMESYKQSLAIAKEVNDLGQQAHCLSSLGQVLDRMGFYAQALQFYQEWIDLKKAMGDRSATLSTLNRNRSSNLAVVNTKYAQAIEFHQQWIEVKRKMGDRQGEANSLGNLGNAFFALGQYPQAIQSYQQCLETARTISDRRSESSSLSGLGSAFFVLGQYTEAIEFHERSLEISQKINDPIIQAKTFGNLGKAYYSLGQYAQAAEKYLTCLEIIQKIGNRQGEANILGDLGNAHYALGKYAQAINFYQQWLEISMEIGDRSQQGNALGGLGNSHNALGQYARAVEFYRQWLEIAIEISDRRSQANALAGLGNAYNALGEYSHAIDFHQQSLKIQKENSDRLTDTNLWAKFADTLESFEHKSLTTNPYKSIEVEATDQDDSAIQQLLAAGSNYSRDIKPTEIRDIKKPPVVSLKPRVVVKTQPQSSNWLNSTFGWLTGKK